MNDAQVREISDETFGERRRYRRVVLILFSLGCLLRLLHLSNLVAGPYFHSPILDSLYHDLWARRFASGQMASEVFFRAPLYPTLLGIMYKLLGRDLYLPRVLGICLGLVTAWLSFKIGSRLFGKVCGVIACGMLLLYWPFIYYEAELLIPATLIALLYLSMFFFFRAMDNPERRLFWALAGLCLGLTAITRPNILVFVPFVVLWPVVTKGRENLPKSLVMGLLIVLVVGSVTLRNAIVGKDFVLISSQGGVNFFIGNNPDADGYTAKTPLAYEWYGEYEDSVQLFSKTRAQELTGRSMKASEVSRFWFKQGLKFWSEHPVDAVKLLTKKTYLFWNAYEIKNNKDLYFQKRFSRVLRLPLLNFGIISVLGIAGIGLWFGKCAKQQGLGHCVRSSKFLLVLLVFLYMVSVISFFVNARYRLPIVPTLAMFGAYAVVEVVRSFRNRAWGFGALPVVIVVLLSLLLGADPYRVRKTNYAEEHWSAANSFQESAKIAESIEEYRLALQEDPEYVDAWHNLGNSHFAVDNYVRAIECYQKALEYDPKYGKSYNNIAQCYLMTGRAEKAFEFAVKAAETQPRNATYRNTLGESYKATGQLQEALKEFSLAVSIYPDYIAAHRNLGTIYLALEQPEQALKCYRRALELNPVDEAARGGMENARRFLEDRSKPQRSE